MIATDDFSGNSFFLLVTGRGYPETLEKWVGMCTCLLNRNSKQSFISVCTLQAKQVTQQRACTLNYQSLYIHVQ